MIPNRCWFMLSVFLVTLYADKPKCTKGQFMVGNMTDCHPYLKCPDFQNIKILKLIGYGAVKWVFLASWNDIFISVCTLKNQIHYFDFHEGLKIMKQLNPSQYINKLVGYCEADSVYATEYQQMNNANILKYVLHSNNQLTSLSRKLCINYIEILKFIHNSPVGTRLNCDSGSIEKILSQLLVTDEYTLVLNDVDALPELTANFSISCGRNISQTLSPPELYDIRNKGYKFGYTDKSDVWKVPEVCNHFFTLENMFTLRYSLFTINKRCKNHDPSGRPSSAELVDLYKEILICTDNKLCT